MKIIGPLNVTTVRDAFSPLRRHGDHYARSVTVTGMTVITEIRPAVGARPSARKCAVYQLAYDSVERTRETFETLGACIRRLKKL